MLEKATPEQLETLRTSTDECGIPILFWAAQECALPVIKYLLEMGFVALPQPVAAGANRKQTKGTVYHGVAMMGAYLAGHEVTFLYMLREACPTLQRPEAKALRRNVRKHKDCEALLDWPRDHFISEIMAKYANFCLYDAVVPVEEIDKLFQIDIAKLQESNLILPGVCSETGLFDTSICNAIPSFTYSIEMTYSADAKAQIDAHQLLIAPSRASCSCEYEYYDATKPCCGDSCPCVQEVSSYYSILTRSEGVARRQLLLPVASFADPVLIQPCSTLCNCDATSTGCPYSIIRAGASVYLEVFTRPNGTLAIRAREPIERGQFVGKHENILFLSFFRH